MGANQHAQQGLGHRRAGRCGRRGACGGSAGAAECPDPSGDAAAFRRSAGAAQRPSQGDGQTLRDGGLLAGWGSLPYFSEFSPSGTLLFNAEFPAGVNTYRAYRFDWNPASR
jgi:hypothetical protein